MRATYTAIKKFDCSNEDSLGYIKNHKEARKNYIHVILSWADFAVGKTAISCLLHDR